MGEHAVCEARDLETVETDVKVDPNNKIFNRLEKNSTISIKYRYVKSIVIACAFLPWSSISMLFYWMMQDKLPLIFLENNNFPRELVGITYWHTQIRINVLFRWLDVANASILLSFQNSMPGSCTSLLRYLGDLKIFRLFNHVGFWTDYHICRPPWKSKCHEKERIILNIS